MPNWCQNTLTITGDNKPKYKKGDELFANYIPRPADIGDNWYDWSCENWGVKWDPEIELVDDDQISFFSAWSAPFEGILRLSVLFPDATFELYYSESGNDFQGTAKFRNGQVLESFENTYYKETDIICPKCGEHDVYVGLDIHGDADFAECGNCGHECDPPSGFHHPPKPHNLLKELKSRRYLSQQIIDGVVSASIKRSKTQS